MLPIRGLLSFSWLTPPRFSWTSALIWRSRSTVRRRTPCSRREGMFLRPFKSSSMPSANAFGRPTASSCLPSFAGCSMPAGPQVRLVVFPEYSIPWDILEELAAAAGDMVVVAGTHTVERAASRSGLYKRLAAPVLPQTGQSVCPILYRGTLLALQPKLSPAVPEHSMKQGTFWAPVQMPESVPGPMGALICLDFLYQRATALSAVVSKHLEQCCFLAVPSLTPYYTLPEFQSEGVGGRTALRASGALQRRSLRWRHDDLRGRRSPRGPGASIPSAWASWSVATRASSWRTWTSAISAPVTPRRMSPRGP